MDQIKNIIKTVKIAMKKLALVCMFGMKKNLKRSVVTLVLVLAFAGCYAQTTFTSTAAGGDWTVGSTWVGGVVPGTNDDVVIAATATVTVPSTQTCRFLTVNGILTMSNTGITLNITNNSTGTLGLTLGSGSSLTIGSANTLNFSTTQSTGIQNNGGTIVSTGTNGADGGRILVNSSSGGGFEIAGTATIVNNLQFVANANFYISGTSLRVNGTFTIPENNWGFNGSSKSPIYGPASTLYIDKNNQGYSQGKEWTVSTGTIGVTPGYPNNVVLVDMGSSSGGTGGTGWVPAGAVGLNGTLHVGNGTQNGRISLENVTSFNSGGIIVDNNSLIVSPEISFINRGNFTLTGGITGVFQNMTGGVMNLAGSGTVGSPQVISTTGSNIVFAEIEVSNGTHVELQDPVSISTRLTLTSGYIRTSTTNSLTISNSATTAISGGGAGAYVDGPLSWAVPATTTNNYTFPIGDFSNSNAYLPLRLSPNTTSGATVTATAFNQNSNGTHDATVTSISTTEYWSVTTSSPFSSGPLVNVTRPSAVSPNNALAVAPSSAGVYTAIGGIPNGGAPGTISGGGIGTASPAFIVMVVAPLSVVKLSSTNYGCTGTTGTLTVGGSGGTPNYTFEIDAGGFVNTTGYFPNLAAGDHIVRVRDAATTIAQATFKILGSVIINGDNKDIIICPTATTRLTATNLQNTTPTFSWSDNASGTPVLQSGTQNYYDANTATNMVSKTYYVTSSLYNNNLLTNGSFESGNTGFTPGYTQHLGGQYGTTPGSGALYTISNAGTNQCEFFSIGGTSNGTALSAQQGSQYFIADGGTSSGTILSYTINGLTIGTVYKFQYYYAAGNPDATRAQVTTSVTNGTLSAIAPTAGATITTNNSASWTQATYSVTPTNSTITITLTNPTSPGGTNGNDFFLDNMELLSPCTVTSSINVIVNCSLPVEFTYFNAVRQGAGALLTWGTAIELNSSHYIIEKSLDGTSFSPIGRVEAAGNSSSLIQYNFTDPSITSGITYYRLAEYDKDGALQYSPIRAVHKEGVGEVEVIPNPNNGTFVVTINNTSDVKSRLVVLNVLGQVVYEEGESASTYRNVDISNLPAGTYYLQVSTVEDTIGKKIIKE